MAEEYKSLELVGRNCATDALPLLVMAPDLLVAASSPSLTLVDLDFSKLCEGLKGRTKKIFPTLVRNVHVGLSQGAQRT